MGEREGVPAVIVSLNSLCLIIPYTVELSFGVREQDNEKVYPSTKCAATLLPGSSAVLRVDVTV